MALFNKKPKEEPKMPEATKVDEIQLGTKQVEEHTQVTIEEVALTMTEHQFKAYVISKLEEITERLK